MQPLQRLHIILRRSVSVCLDLRAVDGGSDEQKQEHQGGGGRAKRTRQRDVHLDGAQCSGARYIGRTSIEFFFSLSGGFFYFESLRSKR